MGLKPRILHILKRYKQKEYEEFEEYLKRLNYLQNRLFKIRQQFDYEEDPVEIEALIYEEKAITIQLNQLMKNSKQIEIPESLRQEKYLFP